MSGRSELPAFESGETFARRLDREDPLAAYRREFLVPRARGGEECVYLAGNSLGLQPAAARAHVDEELDEWARRGVEGHFEARRPWVASHETLTEMSARLVGAKPLEVVVMNTLTVNLHLMMVSFYRPTPERPLIVIEGDAFPSDRYAVASQAAFHGFDPRETVVELRPASGRETLDTATILSTLDRLGDRVALVLLGQVQYLTGEAFDVEPICRAAHEQGALFGLNLAHGAGNIVLALHDWDIDFAVWCGYKYLNGGPGTLAGCFVHERHASDFAGPRFTGWWGHDKASRFRMGPYFQAIPGAEGWQLSNPPILQIAALRASLELFDRATMPALRAKSERLTGYLEYLLDELPGRPVHVVTPRETARRGCQLSLRFGTDARRLLTRLKDSGVVCDFREPDIIRAAPAPLYNTFHDVWRFVDVVGGEVAGRGPKGDA